ncbi:MAG TPA: hypothetical protein VHV74_03670 [Pseudonocardiaceae bacterium]|jgi:hypothetical protein|nr:hypothetical protein [Pseudonocardiaceae bacterium]
MHGTRVFQSAIVGALVVAGVLTGLAPASAAHATAAGIASAGSADLVRNGKTVPVAPVGPCSLTGPTHGASNGASKKGLVTFGTATSTCTLNRKQHTSTSTASGKTFTLSALQAYGGPTIKIASYQVTCAATQSGTNASWQFSGLSGVTVPKQIPNNYQVAIKATNGTLLANVTLNEVILPKPNDGSITLNMMHIQLFPNGTPKNTTSLSGDVYVGSTSCSPTA